MTGILTSLSLKIEHCGGIGHWSVAITLDNTGFLGKRATECQARWPDSVIGFDSRKLPALCARYADMEPMLALYDLSPNHAVSNLHERITWSPELEADSVSHDIHRHCRCACLMAFTATATLAYWVPLNSIVS